MTTFVITDGSLIEAWKNYPETLDPTSPLAIYDGHYIDNWLTTPLEPFTQRYRQHVELPFPNPSSLALSS
jgi:hypothetical protein